MSFTELYEKYSGDVHRFALFLSGNKALADDLTAETFARAFAGRDYLRFDTVKSYLLAITRNVYRDLGRRRWRDAPLEQAEGRADPAPGLETAAGDRERLAQVLDAMRQISVEEREALVLAVDRELPYSEIAAIVGVSVAAVKTRVHRARVRLRALLDAKERR
jgi:RNA polymerase sigma-70 factor, ECF subfamily